MTELQWLIKMLTQHKLPTTLKDLFIERIGEVEAQLSGPRSSNGRTAGFGPANGGSIPSRGTTDQVPSMQRIINEVASESGSQPVANPVPSRVIVPAEVVTSKGNGTMTRGPRKF